MVLPAFSGRAATRSAAVPVAPEEMPTKMPCTHGVRGSTCWERPQRRLGVFGHCHPSPG